MKAFAYVNPTSEKDAVAALKRDGVAMPIGGGQDLLARMKDYVTQPDRLVNIKNALDTTITAMPGGGLKIGAAVKIVDSPPTRRRAGCIRRSPTRPASWGRRRSATRGRSAATSTSVRAAGTSATKSSSASRRADRAASP